MSYDAFEKQPSESYVIEIDFSDRLDTSETVTTATVSAYSLTWAMGRIDSLTAVTGIAPTSTASSQVINVTVSGGTDALSYKVSVTANSSGGKKLSEDVLMWVKEK
jgi:hypothetical protein